MTEQEIKALIEEQKQLISGFQQQNELLLKDRITKTDLEAYGANITKRLEAIEGELLKFKAPGRGDENQGGLNYKAVFEKFLRKGAAALSPEEIKVMTVSDLTTGGYLAPADFTNEIIKGVVEYSPIRQVARVVQTENRSKQWPKKTQSASASWVSEIGSRTETTNPKFGLEEIPTHEMYALAKVSKQDLEDAKYDLMGFLREEFTEQFGVLEGTGFVSGDAVGKPEGFLTNANVSGFTGTTTSAKIVADDLKQVLYSLKEAYARNATWLWKRSSTLAISLLKDNLSNQYLWQPGLQMGAPANVMGRPYVECPDMPAEASSAKAVAIGDWKRGYIIVDRVAIEVLEDPYASKSTGCIEISARKRVGGQVVLPEAIKIYTLKA